MPKVLVTPRSLTRDGHPALERLRAAGCEVVLGPAGQMPSPDELRSLLRGVVGWLAGVERIDDSVLDAALELRVIARNGVGIDSIDLDATGRRGIAVRTTPGANARGVAELAIGLIFALARAIPASDRAIKRGGWERTKGIELAGRTLAVIGCGQIGRHVTDMALGLGMAVVGYDVKPDGTYLPGDRFRYAPLDEAMAVADFVTLHCPAPADGRALIDSAALDRMKPGALLINTARHALIDTVALAEAIENGHIAGAALDVFKTEPPAVDRLLANDRVIATPHVGGYTDASVDRAVSMAVDALLAALNPETCGVSDG